MSKGSGVGSQQLAGISGKPRTGGSETLPKGWIEIQVDKIIDSLESGSRPRGGVKGIESGIPSIGGEHVNNTGGFNFEKIRFIPLAYYESLNKGHIENNDILIVKDGATTGKTSFVDSSFPYKKAVVNEHVFALKTSKNIIPKLTFYFLWSEKGKANILANFQGSAQGGINRQFITNTIIPLPPLNEQKRIVARLDQIMPRIDAVKERLNKVPAIVKRFRQSVLTAAVTGKLTEKWRAKHPDVESAADIATKISKMIKIKNIKSIIIDDEDYPTEWVSTYFTNILSELKNGVSPRPNMAPPGTNILRISANRSGNVNLNDVRYLPNGNVKYAEWLLKEKDLLFTRYNGNIDLVGVCGQVKDIQGHFLYPDKLIRVRLKDGISIPSYIEIVFQSKKLRDYVISKSKSSAGQNGLSGKDLKESVVPIPPLEEQKEIVRQVDKLFALADKLESHYQKAKARVDKLSQSVLAKAFRGELVINEAELAQKEGRDFESAEKLLERILEEKAKLVGSRQRIVGGVRLARGSKGKQKETGGRKNEKD